jgi:hypothetical protein
LIPPLPRLGISGAIDNSTLDILPCTKFTGTKLCELPIPEGLFEREACEREACEREACEREACEREEFVKVMFYAITLSDGRDELGRSRGFGSTAIDLLNGG